MGNYKRKMTDEQLKDFLAHVGDRIAHLPRKQSADQSKRRAGLAKARLYRWPKKEEKPEMSSGKEG